MVVKAVDCGVVSLNVGARQVAREYDLCCSCNRSDCNSSSDRADGHACGIHSGIPSHPVHCVCCGPQTPTIDFFLKLLIKIS